MEKETKGSRTKRQIYECAVTLFRERGFDQVSVDEIMRRAGMAKGTFYIYFETKADIILEMLRQYDDYYDQIMAALQPGMSVNDRLEEIVKGACRFTREVIGLDLIRVLYSKQLTDESPHPGLLNEERALFRILLNLIAEGQNTGVYGREYEASELALLLLRGIRATFFEWCSAGGQLDLQTECLRFLHLYCRGILREAN